MPNPKEEEPNPVLPPHHPLTDVEPVPAPRSDERLASSRRPAAGLIAPLRSAASAIPSGPQAASRRLGSSGLGPAGRPWISRAGVITPPHSAASPWLWALRSAQQAALLLASRRGVSRSRLRRLRAAARRCAPLACTDRPASSRRPTGCIPARAVLPVLQGRRDRQQEASPACSCGRPRSACMSSRCAPCIPESRSGPRRSCQRFLAGKQQSAGRRTAQSPADPQRRPSRSGANQSPLSPAERTSTQPDSPPIGGGPAERSNAVPRRRRPQSGRPTQ
jgi:hypothetical protein